MEPHFPSLSMFVSNWELTSMGIGSFEKEICLEVSIWWSKDSWQQGLRPCIDVHQESKQVPGISPVSAGSKLYRRRKINFLNLGSVLTHREYSCAIDICFCYLLVAVTECLSEAIYVRRHLYWLMVSEGTHWDRAEKEGVYYSPGFLLASPTL